MPRPLVPNGIGIDLLHLPRLNRLLFPTATRLPARTLPIGAGASTPTTEGANASTPTDEEPVIDLRPLQRFATRILSPEELYAFNKKFLGEKVPIISGLGNGKGEPSNQIAGKVRTEWQRRVKQWLGVRWVAKEALYKAYPHLKGEKEVIENGEGSQESKAQGRLTWKDVTLRYENSGKPYLVIQRPDEGKGKKRELELRAETEVPEVEAETETSTSTPAAGEESSKDVETTEGPELDTAYLSITHDSDFVFAMVLYSADGDIVEASKNKYKLLKLAEEQLEGIRVDKRTVRFAKPNWLEDLKTVPEKKVVITIADEGKVKTEKKAASGAAKKLVITIADEGKVKTEKKAASGAAKESKEKESSGDKAGAGKKNKGVAKRTGRFIEKDGKRVFQRTRFHKGKGKGKKGEKKALPEALPKAV